MTLSTHAVAGAAIGGLLAYNPALVVITAFASHFVLDAIPHWDYEVKVSNESNDLLNAKIQLDKKFFKDSIKILIDVLIGVLVIGALFYSHTPYVRLMALVGAGFAVLPDFLQFVYYRTHSRILRPLQDFHVNFMHAKKSLSNRPFLGPFIQIIIVLILSLIVIRFI